MIELLNLALTSGIAAAAAPIVIHIAHRRKLQRVEWGAMRFLLEMLRQKRRSLTIENLLLLLIRVLALACLAFALTRPNLHFRPGLADKDVVVRSGKTAAVLIIDDGLSSAAGRNGAALEKSKSLALAYLDTLKTGDEISLITQSRLGSAPADPLYDLAAARDQVAGLQPSAVASDVPALFEAAINQLARHLNPEAEVVLCSDGRGDGWHPEDRARWEELRRRLAGDQDAVQGTRKRPHLVLLAPEARVVDCNVAVTGIQVDRTLIPAGRQVSVRVAISHSGERAVTGALVRLFVNGRAVAERALDVQIGGKAEYAIPYTFPEPGSYVIEAAIEGARDVLPLDDRRAISVQVESHLPVLLVEGRSAGGLGGSLGLVSAALDPAGDGKDLFSVTRVPLGALTDDLLAGTRVVVLGDLPALDAAGVAALEHFVVAGGGVLVGLGPDTNPELVNRFWSRGGDGFLPCNLLASVQPPVPVVPATASYSHPALAAFTSKAADAWKSAQVRRYFHLDLGGARLPDLVRVISLDNGDPLIIERPRGLGRVALIATSLDQSWSDLPLRPAFVPLVRGLMASLGGIVLPPRNLLPGNRLAWCPSEGGAEQNASAEGPDGTPVALTSGSWEGRHALISEPLLKPGTYQLRVGNPVSVIRYAVAVANSASPLEPLSAQEIKDALHELPLHRIDSEARVKATFSLAESNNIELSRWLVIACLALLFLETLLVRRQASGERTASREAGLSA
jgi:hypothetical protein